jgi:hypothetical protein
MFDLDGNGSDYSEYCVCDCSDEDETYLDQITARNFDEEEASRMARGRASHKDLLEYNLQGINIPIRMLKFGEEIKVNREVHADMDTESPFPATVVETVVTDPIITTPLTSQAIISASSEATSILKRHRKHKKSSQKTGNLELAGRHASGGTTLRLRPPPSTPLEQDAFPHTLSTPHLPVFHHYTDQLLLEQYLVDRAKDPVAFDLQTSKIKKYLLDAKIERGGSRHLEESEYSVDLASREDAARVQRMAIQRHRGMTDTDSIRSFSLEQPTVMPQRPPEYSEQPVAPLSAQDAHLKHVEASNKKGKADSDGTTARCSTVNRELPKDFDFATHVAKYTTSGSMRHQHQRTVLEDENGIKTVLKTWIEITQEIQVSSAEQLGWEDIKAAIKDAKSAVKEEKTNAKDIKQDDEGDEIEAKEDTAVHNDPAELLGAIARITGTGRLSRGVSLSRYLDVIRKDVEQTLEDNSRQTAEPGDLEDEDADADADADNDNDKA